MQIQVFGLVGVPQPFYCFGPAWNFLDFVEHQNMPIFRLPCSRASTLPFLNQPFRIVWAGFLIVDGTCSGCIFGILHLIRFIHRNKVVVLRVELRQGMTYQCSFSNLTGSCDN